ncbi:MAG: flippase-like domain-containing protein [Bacteroidetes bacterium]|nr:flippase-like domain-containing protein [Bacteroidota bacterium]
MSDKIKKYSLNFLKLVVSVIAIWWVLRQISFQEVLTVYSTANLGYLVAGLFFIGVSSVLSGFRQNLSFRVTGARISPLLNLKLFWLGMFYNLFLPGGIGGDGVKVYLVNKYRQNGVKKNIGAMLVNRVAGLVAIGVIAIVLYYISGDEFKIGWPGWLCLPFLYLFYYFVLRYFLKSFLPIHAGLFGWSMLLQLMQLIAALMILYSFHQFEGVSEYLFLFFFSAIATALPITIGGVGAREMVFLLGAKSLHLNNELSIALSLMFFLLSTLVSLGGIYWVFFPPFRREENKQ